jgi:hypothetical protein
MLATRFLKVVLPEQPGVRSFCSHEREFDTPPWLKPGDSPERRSRDFCMQDRRFNPDCSQLRESDIGSTSAFIVVGVPRRPLNSFAFASRGHRETGACPAWFSQGLISDDFGKCFTPGPSPENRQHLVVKEHVQRPSRTRGPEQVDGTRRKCACASNPARLPEADTPAKSRATPPRADTVQRRRTPAIPQSIPWSSGTPRGPARPTGKDAGRTNPRSR